MPVKYIHPGLTNLTAYLRVRGAREAIAFYKQVFGAVEVVVMPGPSESVMHAELKIGDSNLMLSDEFPEWKILGPQSIGGTGVSLALYVPDCDATLAKAVEAGATAIMQPMDQFWGDRQCKLIDPFGHEWLLATHKEDVSHEEMLKRGKMVAAQMCAKK